MIIYIKLILTAAFWGGTWIAGKTLAQGLSPYSVAFLRFLMAAVILLIIIRKKFGAFPPIQKAHRISILLLGLTGVFAYNLFFLQGLQTIEASRASLIMSVLPVVITLLSVLIYHEKLTPLKIIGTLMSVSGAIIVISRGQIKTLIGSGIGKGELLIFGCIASWTAYTFIGKQLMRDLKPLVAVGYSAVVGAVLLAGPALCNGLFSEMAGYSLANWMNIAYLAVFGTVLAFLWFYEGVQSIGPSRTGVFINFVPITTLLLAAAILHEPITGYLVIGALLTLAGVTLTNAVGDRNVKRD